MARPIIIDTDPGVDDAMAIFMALNSPELDVIALTTIFGNVATDIATRNALTLLETAGRSDIPVAVGESKPIASDYGGPVPQVHGTDGLGDADLAEPTTQAVDQPAHELIYAAAAARPGEITLVPVGPLTNIAVALQQHPDLTDLVDEVVIMGGNALVPGNATPVAEANINNDPEAADLVFGADWKVTMVGLDVTHQVNLTNAALGRICGQDTLTSKLLAAALPHYRRFFEQRLSIEGIYVHDPSAIAYLIDPDAFTTNPWPIRVETESFSRGKTWPNLADTDELSPAAWQGRPTVAVCTAVDADRVVRLVEERLTPGDQGR